MCLPWPVPRKQYNCQLEFSAKILARRGTKMKRRFSEEQVIGVLKEVDAGGKISEVCRRHWISDATYYNWKAKYGGLGISEIKRLRQLEDENRHLKQIVADQSLDIQALKGVLSKKFWSLKSKDRQSKKWLMTLAGCHQSDLGNGFYEWLSLERPEIPLSDDSWFVFQGVFGNKSGYLDFRADDCWNTEPAQRFTGSAKDNRGW